MMRTRDVLVLHLVPDGVGSLDTFLDFVLDAHLLERLLNGSRKLVEELVTVGFCIFQLLLDAVISVRVLILE